MAYTDRLYAGLEDDPIPDDPFRKAFGGGLRPSPTPTPKPASTPIQVAGTTRGILRAAPTPSPTPGPLGSQINLQRNNAASRVSPVPQFAGGGSPSLLNLLPNGPVGVPNGQIAAKPSTGPMTHAEMAKQFIQQAGAQYDQDFGAQSDTTAQPTVTGESPQLSSYGLQVQRFGSAANRASLQDPALRPGAIAAATAGGQPLQTATQPGSGNLPAVGGGTLPGGTPLISVKGIVNPFTGQTQYQPLNQPSPFQGPGQYQVQQAATDYYRQRQQEALY